MSSQQESRRLLRMLRGAECFMEVPQFPLGKSPDRGPRGGVLGAKQDDTMHRFIVIQIASEAGRAIDIAPVVEYRVESDVPGARLHEAGLCGAVRPTKRSMSCFCSRGIGEKSARPGAASPARGLAHGSSHCCLSSVWTQQLAADCMVFGGWGGSPATRDALV